jgi:hypothetical protein
VDALLELEDKENKTPMLLAIEAKSIEVIQFLLNMGMTVEHSNKTKRFHALHQACSTGSIPIVKLLLKVCLCDKVFDYHKCQLGLCLISRTGQILNAVKLKIRHH